MAVVVKIVRRVAVIKNQRKKKTGNVEIMPTVNDGQKGMVTKPTNEVKELSMVLCMLHGLLLLKAEVLIH